MNFKAPKTWIPSTIWPKFVIEVNEEETKAHTWIPFECKGKKYIVVFRYNVAGESRKDLNKVKQLLCQTAEVLKKEYSPTEDELKTGLAIGHILLDTRE